MYLVAIAWIYVTLMMAVAEATNTTGTVLGGVVTFVLYGVLPVSLVLYLMGAPMRRRRIKEQERQETLERAAALAASASAGSVAPDESGEAPRDPVAPVRKEN